MIAVKPSKMRENFKSICDDIVKNNQTVIVSRPYSENVVIMSEEAYNDMLKTIKNNEYLAMLDRSLSELDKGGFVIKTLEDLKES